MTRKVGLIMKEDSYYYWLGHKDGMLKEHERIKKGRKRAYEEVLKHRRKCPKWGKEFCIECFGGGLTRFLKMVDEQW